MAAQTSSEALVPVNLALLKLNFLYYYDTYHEVSMTVARIVQDLLESISTFG